MCVILCIETSTKVCSVVLSKNGVIIGKRETHEAHFSHAEHLNLFIRDLLNETALKPENLNAIAVSKGPGSYTGLRIGTSTAKGMCYALDIPLIGVDTLEAMTYGAMQSVEADFYCPMIDARRMEVFTAMFNKEKINKEAVNAKVLTKESYDDWYKKGTVAFFGDGSIKWRELTQASNAVFSEILPSAEWMMPLAQKAYNSKEFVSLPYFEPFYLKDFVAGPPKRIR